MKLSESQLRNIIREILNEKKDGPCWKGYEMVGMKEKGGQQVPNCVPVDEQDSEDEELMSEDLRYYINLNDKRR